MTDINKTIGSNIRALRLKADLTQTELASKIDVTRDAIAKIEGDVNTLSVDTLIKICQVLKTTPNSILNGVYKKK